MEHALIAPKINYKPEVGALSVGTIVRQFSKTDGAHINRASYGANHFNDAGQGILNFLAHACTIGSIGLLTDKFDFDNKNIRQKEKQLNPLDHLIGVKLAENRTGLQGNQIEIDATKNGKDIKITLTQLDNSIEFDFDGDTKVLEGYRFNSLEEELKREEIKILNHSIDKLLNFDTLDAVQIAVDDATTRGTPKVEPQPCPYAFVKINAGTTYHFTGSKNEIADTATTVIKNGIFGATVVDGCDVTAKSRNSRVYSALITAAALHTVEYGFLVQRLTSMDLKKFFFDTLKALDTTEKFVKDDNRAVTFAGVMLFHVKDENGNVVRKQFTYGLGDTAVAATIGSNDLTNIPTVETKTLHLQGNFVSESSLDTGLPAFGPVYKRVTAEHVTAEVSDVTENTKTIQIMTDGCEPLFFDPDTEVKGTVDKPATLKCKALPEHGKFDSKELLAIVNPEINRTTYADFLSAKEQVGLHTSKIESLNKKTGCNLNRESGREQFAKKYADDQATLDKVNLALQKDDELILKMNQLYKQATSTKGDDVFHLSIDVEAAFVELEQQSA